jgi:DNA polymerase III subunit delta'
MQFANVIGHGVLKQQLIKNIQSGRVSHAQLFLGKEGSGNLALALAYAQFLHCENPSSNDSCGSCRSCKKHLKMTHPDFNYFFPLNTKDSKTEKLSEVFITEFREFVLHNPYGVLFDFLNYIGVENKVGIIANEDCQALLKSQILKPYESKYKIILIWLPEKMNIQSANRLLKLLEEPASNTVFLMVSVDSENLLPTIISRTQLVKVAQYSETEIKNALQERYQVEQAKAESIAYISDGNFDMALKQIELSDEEQQNMNLFMDWARACYGFKVAQLFPIIDVFASLGRERQKNFVQYSLHMIRQNLLWTVVGKELVKLSEVEMNFCEKFHQFVNPNNVKYWYEELNKLYREIERNALPKILMMDTSLKISAVIKK